MEKEIWKDVKGYKVSSMGRIFSKTRELKMPNGGFKTIIGREIKQSKTRNGYCYVQLGYAHNKTKAYYVHRLVAEAFPEICGELFEGCQVDHIDTNRENNNADNLRCVTPKENSNNPLTIRHQSEAKKGKKMPFGFAEKQRIIHIGKKHSEKTKKKISESHKNNPKKSIIILQIDVDGNIVKEWASSREAERNGYKHSSINLCCKGICKQHKGFIWKYKEESEAKKIKFNTKRSKPVLQLDKITNAVIAEFSSATEVEEKLGFYHGNITNCCLKKPHYNTAYGFKWKYK